MLKAIKCSKLCSAIAQKFARGSLEVQQNCTAEVCSKLSKTPWSDMGRALEGARQADLKKIRGW